MSGEWKKFLPRAAFPQPTFGVISIFVILCVLIHIYLSTRHYDSLPWEYGLFGLSRSGLQAGYLWQLFTYAFLHGNWMHLFSNVLFLWLLGEKVKHYSGERSVWIVLVGGVLVGGILYMLFQPTDVLDTELGQERQGVLVGASPVLFALLLTLTTVSPESRMWPISVSGRNLGLGVIISSLLLFLFTPGLRIPFFHEVGHQIIAWGMEDIFGMAHISHLGGALFGYLYGRWLLRPRVSLETLRKERERREGNQ